MAGPEVSPPADPRLSVGVGGGWDTTCMKSGKYWVHEGAPWANADPIKSDIWLLLDDHSFKTRMHSSRMRTGRS